MATRTTDPSDGYSSYLIQQHKLRRQDTKTHNTVIPQIQVHTAAIWVLGQATTRPIEDTDKYCKTLLIFRTFMANSGIYNSRFD